jgi:hypothetical protein
MIFFVFFNFHRNFQPRKSVEKKNFKSKKMMKAFLYTVNYLSVFSTRVKKCIKLDPISNPKSVQNLIQFPPLKVYKTRSSFHP